MQRKLSCQQLSKLLYSQHILLTTAWATCPSCTKHTKKDKHVTTNSNANHLTKPLNTNQPNYIVWFPNCNVTSHSIVSLLSVFMKTGTVMKLVRKQTVLEGSQFVDGFPEPAKCLVVPAIFPTQSKLLTSLQTHLKPKNIKPDVIVNITFRRCSPSHLPLPCDIQGYSVSLPINWALFCLRCSLVFDETRLELRMQIQICCIIK